MHKFDVVHQTCTFGAAVFITTTVSQLLFALRVRLVAVRLVVFAAVEVAREDVFFLAVEARVVVFFAAVARRVVFGFAVVLPPLVLLALLVLPVPLAPFNEDSASPAVRVARVARGERVVFAALPSGEGASSLPRRGTMTSL